MRNFLKKHRLSWAFNSVRQPWLRPFWKARALSHLHPSPKEGKISDGLRLALAKKGITVKDRAFLNLKPSELLDKGTRKTDQECLIGLPLYVRGVPGAFDISKVQFSKLLKEASTHISSEPTIYIQDGAVGSSSKCDAKVRIVSDSPSAVISLSEFLWEASSRAISHDPFPLTVYSATTMSHKIVEIVGINSKTTSGFLAADFECASLILFGKSYADVNGLKDALAALAAPVIAARNGIPLRARILAFGELLVLLFAPESVMRSCPDLHDVLLTEDAGAVLFSLGVAPFFRTKCPTSLVLPAKPVSVILATIDSTYAIPVISKISPGQAAYHFLAGYEDGNFLPGYERGPSLIPSVDLAKALLSHLMENNMPCYLVNLYREGKHIEGKELLKLVESACTNSVPESSGSTSDHKVAHLKGRYKSFISENFPDLPKIVVF